MKYDFIRIHDIDLLGTRMTKGLANGGIYATAEGVHESVAEALNVGFKPLGIENHALLMYREAE